MNKILIRTDSSYNIGSGHVTRCIALALNLKAEVHFLCRKLEGNFNKLITQCGFTLHEIDSPEIEIESPLNEIDNVKDIIFNISPDIIIVDHYGVGYDWEEFFFSNCQKILAFDDLNRSHYEKVAILDQNYRTSFEESYNNSEICFLGPKYCVLPCNFINIKAPVREFKKIDSVMVYFGGSDLHQQSMRVYNIIRNLSPQLTINLVLGPNSKDIFEFKQIKDQKLNLLINIKNMNEIMKSSDFFIGAGGATSWERAILGLPTLCITIAMNQVSTGRDLHTAGVHFYLGHYNECKDKEIYEAIEHFLRSKKLLTKYYKKSLELKVGSKTKEVISFLET